MDREQTKGREENGADPAGKPDALTSEKATKAVGQAERQSAGPDGPSFAPGRETFRGSAEETGSILPAMKIRKFVGIAIEIFGEHKRFKWRTA